MINYNKTNKKKKPLAKSRAEDSVQSSNVLLEYFLAKIVELQY